MFGRPVQVFVGSQDGQEADVDELRSRVEQLLAEVAALRREQEIFGFTLMGFEEREERLRRGLERAGIFSRSRPYDVTRRAQAAGGEAAQRCV